MQLLRSIFLLFNFALLLHALALPTSWNDALESSRDLFKRKGGGGGGGKGGSSGGSHSSSSSSSSSSHSGSSSSLGGSSSSPKGITGGTSNTGGATRAGSGSPRAFGSGGAYYGGGAATPYRSGRSAGSVTPFLVGGALVGAAGYAYYHSLYPYGFYSYPYHGYYPYYNTSSNTNESHPIDCICGQYQECGCDVKNETSYLNSVANNNTISRVEDINGTQTLVIDGTLPNGTTAPGGTDSAAGGLKYGIPESSGIWVIVGGVVYTMWFM